MSSSNPQPERTSVLRSLTTRLPAACKLITPSLAVQLLSFTVRFLMARPWLTGVTTVCTMLSMLVMNFGPETTKPTLNYDYTNGGFKKYKQAVDHPLADTDVRAMKLHEPKQTALADDQSAASSRRKQNQSGREASVTQLVDFSVPAVAPSEITQKVTGQIANGPMILRAPGSDAAPTPPVALLKPVNRPGGPAVRLKGTIEIEEQPAFESAEPEAYNGPIIRSAKRPSRSRQ